MREWIIYLYTCLLHDCQNQEYKHQYYRCNVSVCQQNCQILSIENNITDTWFSYNDMCNIFFLGIINNCFYYIVIGIDADLNSQLFGNINILV